MFDEFNNFAGWSLNKLPKKEFLLISSQGTNGSFLLHHFLSMFVKAECNVVFLMVSQTFPHYNVVCSKLGVNLERYREEGNLKIINLLDASFESYLEESESNLTTGFKKLSAKCFYDELLNKLASDKSNLVILDDFLMLLNLGFSEKDLIIFVHYMANLCLTQNCVFITHLCEDIISEKNGHYLYENCRLYASYEVQIRGLQSGYSKDVHGDLRLLVKKKDSSIRWTSKAMQYKLTDRNLNLFAFGTSAAVL